MDGAVLEKRILLPHMQNTVYINYQLLSGVESVRLKLRPFIHYRPLESPVNHPLSEPYTITAMDDRLELSTAHTYPSLRLKIYGERATFTLDGGKLRNVFYRVEERRGYEHTGELWSPGYFSVNVTLETGATLIASTESWETIRALLPEQALEAEHERRKKLLSYAGARAQDGIAAELLLAADQFVITPAGRQEDAARAHAAGEEVRSVISLVHRLGTRHDDQP
jgi:hypothetical protein